MNQYILWSYLILYHTVSIQCNTVAPHHPNNKLEHLASAVQESALTPLDLTYVLYDSSHQLSIVYAYITFLPLVIVVSLVVLIVFTRNIECINQLVGVVTSTVINSMLKHAVKQARPLGSAKSGYGM